MAGEEDSTAAVVERFTGEGALAPESILGSSADTRTADIMAAIMEGGATTEFMVVTAGADGIGAEDTVMAGAGDLALGGRIGVGDGDILTPTTVPGITRQAHIMLIRTTVLRAIQRAIPIRATGTKILHRQIQTRGPCPTRTDPQDPGDHRYREAERIQTTQTSRLRPLRRVGRSSLLTG